MEEARSTADAAFRLALLDGEIEHMMLSNLAHQ